MFPQKRRSARASGRWPEKRLQKIRLVLLLFRAGGGLFVKILAVRGITAHAFLHQAEAEKQLAEDGTVLIKLFLDIPEKPQVQVPPEEHKTPEKPVEPPKQQEYVNIFFIGKNENNEEVYRAVKRVYNKDVDGSKIKYAISSLMLGPKPDEKSKGVYTEIPASTQLLGLTEKPDKVIINLSSAFSDGGGTESVYKRLFQLIKTAKRNTEKPVYLYINGQQADVIGGDGIMITQPLSETSLD